MFIQKNSNTYRLNQHEFESFETTLNIVFKVTYYLDLHKTKTIYYIYFTNKGQFGCLKIVSLLGKNEIINKMI